MSLFEVKHELGKQFHVAERSRFLKELVRWFFQSKELSNHKVRLVETVEKGLAELNIVGWCLVSIHQEHCVLHNSTVENV